MEYPHFFIGNTSSKGPSSIAMLDYRRVHLLPLKIHWMPKIAKTQSICRVYPHMITQYTIFFHNYGHQKRPQAKNDVFVRCSPLIRCFLFVTCLKCRNWDDFSFRMTGRDCIACSRWSSDLDMSWIIAKPALRACGSWECTQDPSPISIKYKWSENGRRCFWWSQSSAFCGAAASVVALGIASKIRLMMARGA